MEINCFETVGNLCNSLPCACLLTPFCEQTVIDSLLNDTLVVLVNEYTVTLLRHACNLLLC